MTKLHYVTSLALGSLMGIVVLCSSPAATADDCDSECRMRQCIYGKNVFGFFNPICMRTEAESCTQCSALTGRCVKDPFPVPTSDKCKKSNIQMKWWYRNGDSCTRKCDLGGAVTFVEAANYDLDPDKDFENPVQQFIYVCPFTK